MMPAHNTEAWQVEMVDFQSIARDAAQTSEARPAHQGHDGHDGLDGVFVCDTTPSPKDPGQRHKMLLSEPVSNFFGVVTAK